MKHLKIQVQGIVQGVGFRPFVHRLALQNNLKGYTYNDAQGIIIHIQGNSKDTDIFLEQLKSQAPVLSKIENLEVKECPIESFNDFQIKESQNGIHQTLISPDIAPCEDCIHEMLDPNNRRYHYPFINCTNCGPRYSIIQDIPYDRKNTTMSDFKLCSQCDKEYHDIQDRRYHAQPNACKECGPKLIYVGNKQDEDELENAINDLKEGKIVAIKGIGGIHLACDANNKQAVLRLRKRKQREAKPFAIMAKDIQTAKELVDISSVEESFLISKERPIVLCKKKAPNSYIELSENKELGIFLPYSPLHILLLERCPVLVMTSANLSDTPVLIDNEEALIKLKDIADSFLLHDRKIENRCDDSLIRIVNDKPYFIRKSRGYAPIVIHTPFDVDGLLALGAHQKGSFALGKNHHVFISPYIGNMETIETMEHFTKALDTYKRLFEITPRQAGCDQHPDYASTLYAQSLDIPITKIYHHHAHMASCMFEHELSGPCFGIIWDGTGLGKDQTIWGAEFLIGDYQDFVRVGSIKPIDLIGNEQAIHEIGRIGLVMSMDANIEQTFFEPTKQEILKKIRIQNSIPATSMGRLFDGLYSILTKKITQDYDGQAPMLLESMVQPTDKRYSLKFYEKEHVRYFDWTPMVKEMIQDTDDIHIKAQKAINTIIDMAIEQVHTLNKEYLPIVLSGGCFQNLQLLQGIYKKLIKENYTVYWHEKVSCNDEGIALGQLAILSQRRK